MNLSYDQLRELLLGGDGDDVVVGTQDFNGTDAFALSRHNVLFGGAGDDLLSGGAGRDTYVFGYGSGHDTIVETNTPGTHGDAGTHNIVQFLGNVTANDLTFHKQTGTLGADLTIELAGSGETLTIRNQFGDRGAAITEFRLADGTVLDLGTIVGNLNQPTGDNDVLRGITGWDMVLAGGAGYDALLGTDSNETLIGGAGDDYLAGAKGNDVYRFGIGDGLDTISDIRDNDTIVFGPGIAPGDLVLSVPVASTNSLAITYSGTGDRVVLANALADGNYVIETISFDDGTVWSWADLMAAYAAQNGTGGDDDLYGSTGNESLAGGAGDDNAWGRNGNDTLDGGDGNDYLDAGSGNDLLVGGPGNDTLVGVKDDDTYRFNAGDGQDVIVDYNHTDSIVFGPGIATTDLSFDVTAGGGSLIVTYTAGGDSVRIDGAFSAANYVIETISFDDGTQWSWADLMGAYATQAATAGADVLYGSAANDSFDGGAGNDAVWGRLGHDTLAGGAGDDQIDGGSGNDILTGGAGDDTLLGFKNNDTYRFAIGDGMDTVVDYSGTDVIAFGPGIATTDLVFDETAGGSGLVVTYSAGGDTLVIENALSTSNYQIESFTFDGGTVWSWADVLAAKAGQTPANPGITVNGTAASEYLTGSAGNDALYGNNGSDTLDGGAGNDYLDGGYYDDVYLLNPDDGQDTISDPRWTDRIEFGTGVATTDLVVTSPERNTNDLLITYTAAGDSVLIKNALTDSDFVIETFKFDDGTTWSWADVMALYATQANTNQDDRFRGSGGNETADGGAGNDVLEGRYGDDSLIGGAGNDLLTGSNGSDTLIGGPGNDYMDGGWHNDVYVLNVGDGQDTITDPRWGDKIVFGTGIAPADLILSAPIQDTNDLLITYTAGGDSVLIKDALTDNDFLIETFQFAGGTTWTWDDMMAAYAAQVTGDDDGRYYGSHQNDGIDGGGGDDHIETRHGDDTITGGSGDDALYADYGNDTLVGGPGNDHLDGGFNDDTYRLDAGDGKDVINDANGGDQVIFGAAILPADLRITVPSHDPDDLRITYTATGDSIVVKNAMTNGAYQIESFHFDGGTVWTWADMITAFNAQNPGGATTSFTWDVSAIGGTGDDTLAGTTGNNLIDGGGGSDTMEGGLGDDTYVFDRGYAEDVVRDTGGDDRIYFGSGVAFSSLAFERTGANGEDLLVLVGGEERLTLLIEDQFSDPDKRIDAFAFEDGSVVTWQGIQNQILDRASTWGHDLITGFDSDDVIDGQNGNDTLTGGGGNDTILGGAGRDAVQYSGVAADYDVQVNGSTVTVTDLRTGAPDGVDTLYGVEDLEFLGSGETTHLVAPNQAPVAGDDTAQTAEDTALEINLATLLANDSDPEGDPLELVSVTADTGQAWINLAGNVSFEPDANFHGTATLTYTITDPIGAEDTGDVTVTVTPVNDPPVVTGPVALATGKDVALLITEAELIANASDIENDPLSVVGLSADSGTLVDNGDGTWTLTPDAGWTGTVNLTYQVSDGTDTTPASGTVDVTQINTAPVVTGPVALSTDEDTALVITEAALLANASDADGDPLSVVNLAADAGTLVDNGDDTWTFTPAADWNGTVNLTYDVSDGAAATPATGTVDVAPVNDAPVVSGPVALSTGWDQATTTTEADLLAVASDPDGDTLTITAVGTPGQGIVTWNADGIIDYAPSCGYYGADSFTYTVADGNGGEVTGTVDVTIATPTGTMGTAAGETMNGNTHANTLVGLGGDDLLKGKGGDDVLVGGAGDDTLDGHVGNDRLYGNGGNDMLVGGNDDDELCGGSGNDLLDGGHHDDTLMGGAGDDTLDGHFHNDALAGGAGIDHLDGGQGLDTLDGGLGADVLTGGGDADTFVFKEGYGADEVADFGISDNDVIEIHFTAVTSFAELIALATQVGFDTVIDFGGGDTLTLTGIDRADLDQNDFTFA